MTDYTRLLERLDREYSPTGHYSMSLRHDAAKAIRALEHDLRICNQNTGYKDKDYIEVCTMVAKLEEQVKVLGEGYAINKQHLKTIGKLEEQVKELETKLDNLAGD